MEEKQIIDKLWDSYELSRSDAIEQRVEIENIAEAKKEAAELKRNISRLGNPNLGAIEEFERVNTRYTYLPEDIDLWRDPDNHPNLQEDYPAPVQTSEMKAHP